MKNGDTLLLLRREWGSAGTVGYISTLSISTLELPWNDNKKLKSCIPTGTYKCVRRTHWRLGETFLVVGVSNRSGIYFHKANWLSQLFGCIALGWEHEWNPVKKQWRLIESKYGFDRFMLMLRGVDWFYLEIKNR